ncbi:hypothetical protein [Paenibacillus cremeus]|uniref:Uncharacterized protein n=1 Tax=Paenibacillus cremeus TaxID=2163881 RepID=A0A559JHM9_9BACL|nr:hypothetical protein [Paenibacillus cremeus]TVX99379.1 hypothetical protein FPZ49_33940 [Paenibacillus cremeus]
MKAMFEINMNDPKEVSGLKELLEVRLSQLEADDEDSVGSPIESRTEQMNNIDRLRDFASQASPNQIDALKWMKANPGPFSAHLIKNDIPILAPHGALSGVFRPGRWQRITGGTKEGFPFLQIDWNHEKGCGIYRGLTPEEADALQL